ncbi:MAG: hypothetical protein E6H07_11530 [Bacteroidetes bacterium]|nr:MAG: hypothetical protein E6H07_11530 [Bacteroidota bacterium]
MSLNDIHLPPGTIADLYKNVLIESGQSISRIETKQTKQKDSTSFLGNNKKQVVIIVSYEDAVHIPDAQLNFLTSILTACKLNLDDIAIINFARSSGRSSKELLKEVPAKSVLLFGVKTESLSLPISFPLFQVQFFDGINYLSSPLLDDIEKDKTLKGQLWTSLKKLFNL